MSQQYEIGSFVVYGKVGVCRVVDRRTMTVGDDTGEYYVLGPVSDSRSSLYIPCGNPQLLARLRPLLTREAVESMLDTAEEQQIDWIDERNRRGQEFREIVSGGDRRELVRLIRCLFRKKQERVANGKQLSSMDEGILADSLRLVEEEFSLALDIPRNLVGKYIRSRMENL